MYGGGEWNGLVATARPECKCRAGPGELEHTGERIADMLQSLSLAWRVKRPCRTLLAAAGIPGAPRH